MDSGEAVTAGVSLEDADSSVSELREKHRLDLENLTLATQPLRTLRLFIIASLQYLKRLLLYVVKKGGWFTLLTMVVMAFGLFFVAVDGLHEEHVQEFLSYFRFVIWWVALGVASSIGLGSGLHTFVLYLGPHIALFTLKSMKCGRVDLKTAPYDTIQLKGGPSWLEKDCSEFGPPVYQSSAGSFVKIPINILLPQVQLEAMLWGLGTALGELPPYFISTAGALLYSLPLSSGTLPSIIGARLSGSKLDAIKELDASSHEDGLISSCLNRLKRWLLSHSQYLNFITILLLASVPNPLFDLAGIMCGQFGVPFWKFFLPTFIGKAIIKAHLQTILVIAVCNNQLLDWVENELLCVLGLFPGFSYMLPYIIAKLQTARKEYLSPTVSAVTASDTMEKRWTISLSLLWNTVVWLMVVNFFIQIVTATARKYLKKQQELELARKLSASK